MKQSTVESVNVAEEAPHGWIEVKLTDEETLILLNQNWVNSNGELKVGDKLNYEAAVKPLYSYDEHLFLKVLERVKEK